MIKRICEKLYMHLAQHPMQLQSQLLVPGQLYLSTGCLLAPQVGARHLISPDVAGRDVKDPSILMATGNRTICP